MPGVTRRRLLYLGGAGILAVAGVRLGLPWLIGPTDRRRLNSETEDFVERCFAGLDRSRVWDTHVHLIGLGAGGTGCEVHPDMLDHLHPFKRFQFDMYRAGAGIANTETADTDYIERLLRLQRAANPEGKLVLLAFDRYVDENGNERPDLSPIFTPNEYGLEIASEHPQFLSGASIHPYRHDAVDRLDAVAGQGAVAVKWLPNAMGIDPASARCDGFYRRMAELGLPLICHAGKEYAVDSAHHQDLGNPLRLRRALDAGVRVVVAHCASMGSFPDLDAPSSAGDQVASFDLFMRMFTDSRYETNLIGDISTMIHTHHGPRPLRELLKATELHSRLVYGSDYPLPALRFMISPMKLQLAGLLGVADRGPSDELFDYNPLLFDFAINRALRLEEDGTTYRFSRSVFESARIFRGISHPGNQVSPGDA